MTIEQQTGTREPETESASVRTVVDHIAASVPVIASLVDHKDHIAAWADDIAARLVAGRRLLAAGNGGSAAEAQHLTSELTGRFDGDRPAYSAISLHAESSAVTAIGNDYGYDQVFARQVTAHARAGDVVVLLSTSGKSPNLLRAAEAARAVGARSIAMTGPGPNPLADAVDDAIRIEGPSANVQEAQLVLVHALCRAMEPALRRGGRR
ncbi:MULTISPECIES: SIS domain-containing protein [unclassified Curtobacterium]|jgi:phosphoheptose isomerase|uniref:D-sedoheptulose-7-phosphate isomerase n=1 Tax=unclassified Curtobacterium TaxID=257496 RepID=UPI00052A5863|nr:MULTISPECIES: SIS domain-containing protein [unclassified Curtobacterium]AIV40137.1 phosphoheptose isomerase [Curtobacterium sp. MR_MD2014]MBP1300373.1 phosphoheptose isomerase [Curtobacterium sp. 1310]MCM3506094.1 SIS domain-containing protein [Curtobacterium sp. ODYSSEY 48 V2]MCM3521607.1 SIS domain-containing protein [Curtobacterium sp. P97]MDB6426744.1 SIS domain-containing protein [Curtobacterium sp. 20TX0008]